jgi:hypothetical protein
MEAQKVAQIAQSLKALTKDLDTLEEAGGGIPAVERNVIRLRGTLRALEIQFGDLADLEGEAG